MLVPNIIKFGQCLFILLLKMSGIVYYVARWFRNCEPWELYLIPSNLFPSLSPFKILDPPLSTTWPDIMLHLWVWVRSAWVMLP